MKRTTPLGDVVGEANPLERSPLHLLHRVGQCASDIYVAELSGLDLTPRQYAVLITVKQHEGLSQTDLVEKTGIDRSTLADIVRRMLKKGLLQRRRTREDARAYAVKVTEEGARMLALASPKVERVDARLLEALPAEERERFIHSLATIIAAVSAPQPAQA